MENRPVPIVIAVAIVVFGAHAAVAIWGGYLNYVSGIWLALADDLNRGVFYREIINEHGYGGTRYFPLFFVVIAGFMRAGASPLVAGWLASGLTAVVLASGMFTFVRAAGGPRLTAGLFAAASLAPYFIQQTLFEVRADVLAAALNVWGLAFITRAWRMDERRAASVTWSAVCFALALAAKVTSAAIPMAVIVGLLVSGRARIAGAFLWRFASAVGVFFLLVQWASDGRALESWRACMFAGTDAGGTFGALLGGDFLRLTRYSNLLLTLLVTTIGTIALAVRAYFATRDVRDGRAVIFASVLFLGTTGATALLLSSPGTVPSNQMVEWILIVLAVLAFLACLQPRVTRAVIIAVSLITLYASWQNVVRTRQIRELTPTETQTSDMKALVARVASLPAPVLSESALWPVVAGREVYMLDPFALRVVMHSRRDIEQDLASKIEKRMFPMVILQVDPTTTVGRGYYENVNFGWPITQRILDHYRLESHPVSDVYVYVPR